MIRALGIDPALKATGVALPDGQCRTIAPAAKELSARLHRHYCDLYGLARESNADVAVMEKPIPPRATMGLATMRLCQLSGVYLLALYELAIPVIQIYPGSVKAYFVGNGHATKEQMLAKAKAMGATVANHNEADAYALRAMAIEWYDGDNDAALARHKWPVI